MNRWRTILWLLTHRRNGSGSGVRVVSFAEPHAHAETFVEGVEANAHVYWPMEDV